MRYMGRVGVVDMDSVVSRFYISHRVMVRILKVTLRQNTQCTSLCFRRRIDGRLKLASRRISGTRRDIRTNINIHIIINSHANCTCARSIALRTVQHTTHTTGHVTANRYGSQTIRLSRLGVGRGHCPVISN